MTIETLLALLLSAAPSAQHTQKERCAHHQASGAMMCVERRGHCMEVSVDGHHTAPLTDEATGQRVNAIKHNQDVCWQITQPVSNKLRVTAQAGGIFPAFLGKIEKIDAHVFELGDYDPKVDSRLEQRGDVALQVDGDPNGTWQLTSDRPLPAGEYVIAFQVFGEGNWDKQAVLLTLDPALSPAPAGK